MTITLISQLLNENDCLLCSLIHYLGEIPPLWSCLSLQYVYWWCGQCRFAKNCCGRCEKYWQLLWSHKDSISIHTFVAILSIKWVKYPFSAVSVSDIMPIDDADGAHSQRTNMGDVIKIDNIYNITNNQGSCIPFL